MEAGFHEVVSTEESKRQAEEAKKHGKSPWRINTTLFASTQPDVILKPLGKFATPVNLFFLTILLISLSNRKPWLNIRQLELWNKWKKSSSLLI